MDQGFKDEVIVPGALLDTDVEVVRRNPADQGKGFVPQPKRWVVEQANGTLCCTGVWPVSTTTGPTPPPPASTGPPPRT